MADECFWRIMILLFNAIFKPSILKQQIVEIRLFLFHEQNVWANLIKSFRHVLMNFDMNNFDKIACNLE